MELIKYNQIDNVFERSDDGINTPLPQIIWHITSKCKLNCVFCFAKKNKDSIFNIDEIILLLKKFNVLKVDISGGEPLLSSQFISICNSLYKSGINITLTTTGLGKKENFEWLLKNVSKFSRIIFSIDGEKEMHDKLRQMDGAFSQAMEKISGIEKIYNKIRINTVVTQSLINSDYRSFINIIDNLCPYEWCLIQMHPANDKGKYDELSVDDKIFDEFVTMVKLISSTNIIQRKNNDYSGYWTINSDNTISMHSETSNDRCIIEIKKENYKEIEGAIYMEKSKFPVGENNEIKIINTYESENISYMLEVVASICEKNNMKCEVDKKNITNKKNEIVATIAIGIATGLVTSTIYDAIKYAIHKIKARPDYNSGEKISINGEEYNLKDIEEMIEKSKQK